MEVRPRTTRYPLLLEDYAMSHFALSSTDRNQATSRTARALAAHVGLTVLPLLVAACASTGATLGSGVGDTFMDEAPWYAGARVSAGATSVGAAASIGHLPITFQRGATQPGTFDPTDTPVAALLAEMNAFLDSLGATVRIAPSAPLQGTPPDVMFGCERYAGEECEDVPERGRMRLAVGRPSAAWTAWAAAESERAGVERVLVITLEIGNYLPYQRNWRGSKEVRLGTGYNVDVPWLTATDAPASVLQLTGALVDRDGRAIRIGAEGLVARRTNVLLSGLGAQALISDDDVVAIRAARRDDLPGRPLVWQTALLNMVAQLTGQSELVGR
jgi:hypothetical protein